MTEKLIALKIGRYEYDITEADNFMDNGSSVQLLTQSKEPWQWGCVKRPILSQRAIKELATFQRVQHMHDFAANVQVFHLS